MDEKLAIAWIDLTFKVNPFFMRKEKIILNDIDGSVDFGSLNALMGPSGSGKTSFLKCINGKSESGIGGESKIFLSSREKIRSCFIGQHEKEHLIMGLTAKQNLIYASKLKNSGNRLKIDHKNNAMNLMSELMISDIADNKVEDCSGGEQKRLSIALEMTQHIKPNLLCIDEPTTGLDSNAAEVVNFILNYFEFISIFLPY
jgi:ABC-type multidrug transport system ATPase subunit